jgi:hypothetical protein
MLEFAQAGQTDPTQGSKLMPNAEEIMEAVDAKLEQAMEALTGADPTEDEADLVPEEMDDEMDDEHEKMGEDESHDGVSPMTAADL